MNIGLIVKDFAMGKQFSKDGLPTKSGAEFHAENHALQLIKKGHNVTIMAKKRYWFTKARENYSGIDLVRLHAPFRWLEIWLRLLSTHRNIDVFYILGKPSFAVWVILYAKIFNKRVVMSLTGKSELFTKNNWRNKLFTKCDHYLALSQEIHDGFIEKAEIDPGKITILGQGIDTDKFPCIMPKDKSILRNNYGFDNDNIILLFCARIAPNKGIDLVMKIWPRLHKEFCDSKLLVVGGGQHEWMEKLKNLSEECGQSVIVTGEVNNPRDYYQMSDIYIFPSHHEGLPTTLIEAMSCGLPSVVSDIGGCRDLIKQNESGYLIPVDNEEGFYQSTRELFLNQEKRHCLGKNASEYVHDNCDYKKVITILEEKLDKCR